MKITLTIEQEDLRALYNSFIILKQMSLSVQDWALQLKARQQEERIKELIKPLI